MLKNFFFAAFKRKKEFKELSKIHGEIQKVGIIIISEKLDQSTLNITFKSAKTLSAPFTEDEIKKFLKALSVKQEMIDETKKIFALLDFTTKAINIQQIKKSGEKQNVTL